MHLLFIFSIILVCIEVFNEYREKEIPAEYWANKELYHKDVMDGVPIERRMKNLENGKYRLVETHSEQHK